MAGTKNNASMPKDLQAMSNILKDFAITDHETGVENHMLDFTNSKLSFVFNDFYYLNYYSGKSWNSPLLGAGLRGGDKLA